MTRHSPIFRHFKNYSLMLTQLVKKISAAILVYGTSGTRTHFRCVFLNSPTPKTMETIPHTLILRQTQNLAHLTVILAVILFYGTSAARTNFRCVFLNSLTPKTMETIPHTLILRQKRNSANLTAILVAILDLGNKEAKSSLATLIFGFSGVFYPL